MVCSLDFQAVILLICGVFGSCLWGSTVRCYSLFYDPVAGEFEVDYAAVSLITSLGFVGLATGSALSSSLFKIFGYSITVAVSGICSCLSIFASSFSSKVELISVGVGLIPGLALAPLQISTLAIASTYNKRLADFFGQMFFLGISVGPFLLCPCYQFFIEVYGWRGALQIIAGLFLNISVCGVALRRFQPPHTTDIDGQTKHPRKETVTIRRLYAILDVELLFDPSFYLYVFASAAFCSVFFSSLSYIPLFGTKVLGIDALLATTLVSAMSVGDGISKFGLSVVSHRIPKNKRLLTSTLLMFLLSMSVLFLSLSRKYEVAMLACVMIGLSGGGVPGLRSVTSHNVFGQEKFASSYGYCNAVAFGVSSAVQYLIAILISSTDNLSLVYYVGVGLGLLSTCIELSWHLYFFQTRECKSRPLRNEDGKKIKSSRCL